MRSAGKTPLELLAGRLHGMKLAAGQPRDVSAEEEITAPADGSAPRGPVFAR